MEENTTAQGGAPAITNWPAAWWAATSRATARRRDMANRERGSSLNSRGRAVSLTESHGKIKKIKRRRSQSCSASPRQQMHISKAVIGREESVTAQLNATAKLYATVGCQARHGGRQCNGALLTLRLWRLRGIIDPRNGPWGSGRRRSLSHLGFPWAASLASSLTSRRRRCNEAAAHKQPKDPGNSS